MKVLQLPQGHCHPSAVVGLTLDEVLRNLRQWDADFAEKFHLTLHRPSWQEIEVPDDGMVLARAPWGHEWWCVGDDGRLFLHSADYDSSG